ncbi:MAG: L-arabinose isomerase [Balneola sp.]|nr:L-arabinose isomerase [Balneola sp.]|tara:strand:- start:9207 stop:10697 length:1491 start_codon:yes stop_codon:yes gene_type:complete
MNNSQQQEIWFVTGSQHLYGEETLKQVEVHSQKVAAGLNERSNTPADIVFKTVLTTSEAIKTLMLEANSDPKCIGLITWMHTFSPSKMWIAGLKALNKPFVHLHTQFNRDIPWNEIDMDFMNLNQSAHGGREFGFINAAMGIDRKVIAGHWQDSEVISELDTWIRAAIGKHELENLKVARFGDNMRNVAVTEGDKVSAQLQFGLDVRGFGVGDLVEYVKAVSDSDLKDLLRAYNEEYKISKEDGASEAFGHSIKEAARIELGIKAFLDEGGFGAFTTTFEDLHGLEQLPGISAQRLMQQGYGFAAEGDWKTAALVRITKKMAEGLKGGTSFMEDYTYHFNPDKPQVLGAHMLEICPSITNSKASLEVHPLGIGGKADPARLVFTGEPGDAVNIAMMDLGNRYRMIVNKVEATETPDLPKLPVARVLWDPKPNLKIAAQSWILAGGAHHTSYSQALTVQHAVDLAEMLGIECLVIDEKTDIRDFKQEVRTNSLYFSR